MADVLDINDAVDLDVEDEGERKHCYFRRVNLKIH